LTHEVSKNRLKRYFLKTGSASDYTQIKALSEFSKPVPYQKMRRANHPDNYRHSSARFFTRPWCGVDMNCREKSLSGVSSKPVIDAVPCL
jgi:hypothetical protein